MVTAPQFFATPAAFGVCLTHSRQHALVAISGGIFTFPNPAACFDWPLFGDY
ncbi:hypothetical protein [Rhodoligotrophos ferricapiens]|uniref:hypothetical protein n=1 Tax=Rhodoligotrophos ferricapiens TaxID=3069264 RepID=UPI00315DECD0